MKCSLRSSALSLPARGIVPNQQQLRMSLRRWPVEIARVGNIARWPILTPLKVHILLRYLEQRSIHFKRDDFLEEAKGMFRRVTEVVSAESMPVEQLRDVLTAEHFMRMMIDKNKYSKRANRVCVQLDNVDAEIHNVFFLNKPNAEQPQSVRIDVKFKTLETMWLVSKTNPPEILGQKERAVVQECDFRGSVDWDTVPSWRIAAL